MKLRHRLAAAALLALPLLATADDSGWVTTAPDNAGYTAEFPATPAYQKQEPPHVTSHIWQAKSSDENVMVLVGVTDYWEDIDTDEELRLDQKNFLDAIGGTASTSSRETFPGAKKGVSLPSQVFDFSTASGWNGRSRVIKDGNTVWQYAILWKQGYDGSAALELFEKSFKLVPRVRPAPPPEPTPAPGSATGN